MLVDGENENVASSSGRVDFVASKRKQRHDVVVLRGCLLDNSKVFSMFSILRRDEGAYSEVGTLLQLWFSGRPKVRMNPAGMEILQSSRCVWSFSRAT